MRGEVGRLCTAAGHRCGHPCLSLGARQRTSAAVPGLFDMRVRSLRRERAALRGVEPFLHERAFEDCLDRVAIHQRRFERALLIGCPDGNWPIRMGAVAEAVEVRDPGSSFAASAGGQAIVEDAWEPTEAAYDLVLSIGTLDTVNDLRLALRLVRHAMRGDGLFLGAVSGGDTLPQLRAAMRAADAVSGVAAPHVHPRIEASALAPLLSEAGFTNPVVDLDRVAVSYRSFDRLVGDIRAMAATNVLTARPHFLGRAARAAAAAAFEGAGDGERTTETFEILHFAGWTPKEG
jgi:NADH dehydrogenase [ubiquinone] 1 alpha subcomplex assembly factor 5